MLLGVIEDAADGYRPLPKPFWCWAVLLLDRLGICNWLPTSRIHVGHGGCAGSALSCHCEVVCAV